MARRLAWPCAGVLAGLALLAVLARVETWWLKQQPWHSARLDLEAAPTADDEYAASVRMLPRSIVPEDEAVFQELARIPDIGKIVRALEVFDVEWLVSLDAPQEVFAELIESGRIPEPGTGEVLAGALARVDAFELDGHRFEVVGRLRPSVLGFAFTYVLPADARWEAMFQDDRGALLGHVDPEYYHSASAPPEMEEGRRDLAELRAGLTPTHPRFAWATLLLMLLVAISGATAQVRLFTALAGRLPRPFNPLTRAMCHWPRLLIAVHAALLGTFFAAMAFGLHERVWNARILSFITHEFTEGDLGYIGTAFDSGNALNFAGAIFHNNFVVQTLALTFLISIPPFALGCLKTALTFALAGFGLAPIWTGTAQGYWFHALTMTLEFEPYILASFAVLLWPVYVLRAMNGGIGEFRTGAWIFLSAVLWSAVLLAVAALYEAVTILLFG